MHGSTKCGAGWPMGAHGGHHAVGIPLIPAPVAFVTMMLGLMMGVMIGRHCSMTMHGTGMGDGCCGTATSDDMAATHHHHGKGTPPCTCDAGAMARHGHDKMPAE